MFTGISVSELISKIILNTLLSSIPEELFLVLFTLIFIKEFDYLKYVEMHEYKLFDKWNLIRVLTPTISVALISNILRYTGIRFELIFPLALLSIFMFIVIMNDLWKDNQPFILFGKTALALLLASLMILVIEFTYIPFILYSTGKSIEYINNSILWNFLMSLPERFIEALIILFLLTKKATFLRSNILKSVFSSKVLVMITSTVLLLNVFLMVIMCQAIGYQKILINLSLTMQFMIIIGNILFPIINISAVFLSIYYIDNHIRNNQATFVNVMSGYIDNINDCTNSGEYDKIRQNLNQI